MKLAPKSYLYVYKGIYNTLVSYWIYFHKSPMDSKYYLVEVCGKKSNNPHQWGFLIRVLWNIPQTGTSISIIINFSDGCDCAVLFLFYLPYQNTTWHLPNIILLSLVLPCLKSTKEMKLTPGALPRTPRAESSPKSLFPKLLPPGFETGYGANCSATEVIETPDDR